MAQGSHKDFEKLRVKIIARAWKDPHFKKRLHENPRAVFKEMGLTIPDDVKIHVIEDKNNSYTFVLPHSPVGSRGMSESELDKIAAGACADWSKTWIKNTLSACISPTGC